MENYKEYLEVGLELLGSLVVVATIVVRVTPSESDNKYLAKALSVFNKLLFWAPTLGVNPNTKKLMEAQKELEKKA